MVALNDGLNCLLGSFQILRFSYQYHILRYTILIRDVDIYVESATYPCNLAAFLTNNESMRR